LLGLPGFGKAPTSWSGSPLAASTRCESVHVQLEVLVALTEAELLNTLLL
jgi:hypothetical protein